MPKRQQRLGFWVPEALLLMALLFLALRDLGTFPAPWADDSLFMIVVKMVATGRGYVLPVLGYDWAHPYILAVGPTVIYPAAAAVKLFGFSIAAERSAMVLYLLVACGAAYAFTRSLSGTLDARLTATLAISLSAFVNTGKMVMGEVPASAFLILGLLALRIKRPLLRTILAGLAFGLAAATKLPFALVFPALGIAWLFAMKRKDWKEGIHIIAMTAVAAGILAVGAYFLGAFEKGFYEEIRIYVLGGSGGPGLFNILLKHPVDLLRAAYAHFAIFALLGAAGWWNLRKNFRTTESAVLLSLVALFTLYFLNGSGWYRHLLPATLLLFLLAPRGAQAMFGKYGGVAAILAIVAVQGWWQLDYRGSSSSPEAREAADALIENFSDRTLLVYPAEVFVFLPENPHWLFLSEELHLSARQPEEIRRKLVEARCLPILKKVSREERDSNSANAIQVSGRFFLFDPPPDCAAP